MKYIWKNDETFLIHRVINITEIILLCSLYMWAILKQFCALNFDKKIKIFKVCLFENTAFSSVLTHFLCLTVAFNRKRKLTVQKTDFGLC